MAFVFVALTAALLLGNGLRTQVVDYLVQDKAPAVMVSALAPDLVLGRTLDGTDAPTPRPVAATRSPARSVTPVQARAEVAPRSPDAPAASGWATRAGGTTSRRLDQGAHATRGGHAHPKRWHAHGHPAIHRVAHRAKHRHAATMAAPAHQRAARHHAKHHHRHHGRHHHRRHRHHRR